MSTQITPEKAEQIIAHSALVLIESRLCKLAGDPSGIFLSSKHLLPVLSDIKMILETMEKSKWNQSSV